MIYEVLMKGIKVSKLTLASALALSLIAPVATPASAAGLDWSSISGLITSIGNLFQNQTVTQYGHLTDATGPHVQAGVIPLNAKIYVCGSKCINSKQKDGWALTQAYKAGGIYAVNPHTGNGMATTMGDLASGHPGDWSPVGALTSQPHDYTGEIGYGHWTDLAAEQRAYLSRHGYSIGADHHYHHADTTK